MKKQNFSTPKSQDHSLNDLRFQDCKISGQDQHQIKGGSADGIIIHDDMII